MDVKLLMVLIYKRRRKRAPFNFVFDFLPTLESRIEVQHVYLILSNFPLYTPLLGTTRLFNLEEFPQLHTYLVLHVY